MALAAKNKKFDAEFWSGSDQPNHVIKITQLAFTCLKYAIETLEQGVKYVQS